MFLTAKRSTALFVIPALLLISGCSSSAAVTQASPSTGASTAPSPAQAVDVFKKPNDIPGPVNRGSQTVVIHLTVKEVVGNLTDKATYPYWTYDGTVPGPFLRVRVGDTVEIHLKNDPTSKSTHSIDLHAVSGPGGGGGVTQAKPGEEKTFAFKALFPGLFMYHCASPHIPTHIANGMYGLILVEPEGGLPQVDREYYLMQGEIFTLQARGAVGPVRYDVNKLLAATPTFFVFNCKVAGLTGPNALTAKVGERVRLYVGNAGPSAISSFHVIGMVFSQVHPEGASEIWNNVSTTLVPAGGATWVELTAQVPGTYTILDHAISRAIDGGAVAQLVVSGPPNPAVFSGDTSISH